MDAHHLHAGVEEEDAACEHQIVEFRQIGEESLRHVHLVVPSRSDVDDSQNDQQSGRDDRTDHSAPFADLSDPADAFERDEGCDPVDGQHHDEREELVGGQNGIGLLVQSDEGDRHGAEGEDRRIPDRRFDPLQPDGKESRAGSERLADPTEDASLLVGEHRRQFGCHQRGGNQEDNRCKKVIERRRRAIDRFGRQPAQADDRRDVHDGERCHAEFESCTCFCFHRHV